MMGVLSLLVGVVLLVLGRKIFWMFVAGIGFLTTFSLVTQLTEIQQDWLVLLIALAAGAIGALLAIFLQQVAIAIAGFLAGGYIVLGLLRLLELDLPTLSWVIALVGGAIGAMLTLLLFDWALIFLSSLSGATVIVESLDLTGGLATIVLVAALLAGVFIQSALLDREQAASPAPPNH
jgi:hypothetical protein